MKSDTTFQLFSKLCPTQKVGDCDVTMAIAGKTGTLSGDELVIELSGTNSAVCTEGTKTNSFTLRIGATKK
ncbi:hypothetical protein HMI51_36565 [Corallococcus coralloides]|nr:hypothetical protein [Corallococcus coralloides]